MEGESHNTPRILRMLLLTGLSFYEDCIFSVLTRRSPNQSGYFPNLTSSAGNEQYLTSCLYVNATRRNFCFCHALCFAKLFSPSVTYSELANRGVWTQNIQAQKIRSTCIYGESWWLTAKISTRAQDGQHYDLSALPLFSHNHTRSSCNQIHLLHVALAVS